MTLAADTLIVKELLAAMFESNLGANGNDRAKAVIDGFFPGAFSGVLNTRSLTLKAGVNMTASPDTDNTDLVVDIGAALPAGAMLASLVGPAGAGASAACACIIHLVTPFSGGGLATLSLAVGDGTDATSIVSAFDLMGTAGYSAGTVGDLVLDASQLVATVNPDASSKTSDPTAGEVKITVFYVDATDA